MIDSAELPTRRRRIAAIPLLGPELDASLAAIEADALDSLPGPAEPHDFPVRPDGNPRTSR